MTANAETVAGAPLLPTAGGPRIWSDPQILARLTGVLFIVTFATSIPPVLWRTAE